MTYEQLISYYGTQVKAAEAIGLKQPSIADWKKTGIPIGRQAQYELATDGALVADRPKPINKHSANSSRASQ